MNEELSAQELANGRTDGRHTIIRLFGRIKIRTVLADLYNYVQVDV